MQLSDQASYLASLVSLLDSFDDAGVKRPTWLSDEYTRVWGEFKEAVEAANKERERKSNEKR